MSPNTMRRIRGRGLTKAPLIGALMVVASLALVATAAANDGANIAAASPASPAAGGSGFPPGKLYIEGDGQLLIPYDMASVRIDIDIKEENTTASNAAVLVHSKHEEVSQNLLNIIEGELGIPLDNITTTRIDLDPIYNYSTTPSSVIGYDLSSRMTLRFAANNTHILPKLYEAVAAIGSDANNIVISVDNFDGFVSDELRKASEVELSRITVANAAMRAQIYAETGGRQLGPLMTMSDNPIEVESSGNNYRDFYDPKAGSWRGSSGGSGGLAGGMPSFMTKSPLASKAPSRSKAAKKTSGSFLLGKGEKLRKTIYMEYILL